MSFFDELKKKPHVANHPIGKHHTAWVEKVRENASKRAQLVDEEDYDLKDMFSEQEGGESKVNTGNGELRDVIKASVDLASKYVNQLQFPVRPEIRYIGSRNVRHANDGSRRVVEAHINLECSFMTLTGVKKSFDIPVTYTHGEIVPPSTVIVDGTIRVLAQSTVDDIIHRYSSYELEPVRDMFDPFMTRDEKVRAVEQRNSQGYQPRRVDDSQFLMKKSQEEADERSIIMAAVDSLYGGLYSCNRSKGNSWECKLHSPDGQKIWAEIKGNVVEVSTRSWSGDPVVDEVPIDESLLERGGRFGSKTSKNFSTPPMYKEVTDLMEEAEKNQEDTFPRMYHHLLRNYILQVVSTAEKDRWMIHLINDGYCINPNGPNRGRPGREASKRPFDKNAQNFVEGEDTFGDFLNDLWQDHGWDVIQEPRGFGEEEMYEDIDQIYDADLYDLIMNVVGDEIMNTKWYQKAEDTDDEAAFWEEVLEDYRDWVNFEIEKRLESREAVIHSDEGRSRMEEDPGYYTPETVVLDAFRDGISTLTSSGMVSTGYDVDGVLRELRDNKGLLKEYIENQMDFDEIDGDIDWDYVLAQAKEDISSAYPWGHYQGKQAVIHSDEGMTIMNSLKGLKRYVESEGMSEFLGEIEDIAGKIEAAQTPQDYSGVMSDLDYLMTQIREANPPKVGQQVPSDTEEPQDKMVDEFEEMSDNPVTMYPGTVTPMEIGDGVKHCNGGPGKATIVEIMEDGRIIIKSKGMEYRVNFDEIEPLPGTFKKMYMEGKRAQIQTTEELNAEKDSAYDIIENAVIQTEGDEKTMELLTKYGDLISKWFSISVAYETWSEEDLEIGDTDDKGWEYEGDEVQADDLEGYFRGNNYFEYDEYSGEGNVWRQTEDDVDIATGERTVRTMFIDNADGTPVSGKSVEFLRAISDGKFDSMDIYNAVQALYSSEEVEQAVKRLNEGQEVDPNQLGFDFEARRAQMDEEALVQQYIDRADAAREAGGFIEYDPYLPSISIVTPNGEEYYFQESDADYLLEEIPDFIRGGSQPLIEDYLLAIAQEW